MTSSNLSLASHAHDSIVSHARSGAAEAPPAEVCGVLVGDRSAGSITTVVPVSNVSDEPRLAYELDPAETVAAFEDADSAGLDVVGFYHSHPESAPVPSAADREQASWPGYVYLICHPDGRLTAHEWTGTEFRELEVSVE
ncbi:MULTISPECIES: desampylase [Haloferax]|uniref:Peptidase n=2 Tax=Haloferax TaxID=2251 RepID=A0A6G1Z1V4_9EURY|nr:MULTISPECIES: desampylase [Haloferax]KAB1187855.1 M67 family metallopeptidase [Haloferax sp. CBA1149]MRW80516.1 peptidase [Haloferax marinisediminis]